MLLIMCIGNLKYISIPVVVIIIILLCTVIIVLFGLLLRKGTYNILLECIAATCILPFPSDIPGYGQPMHPF